MSEERPRVWVYGVVPADARLEQLESRDDLPDVWLVEAGDLAAIVGHVPENDAKRPETRRWPTRACSSRLCGTAPSCRSASG
jgi:hypothetical protein